MNNAFLQDDRLSLQAKGLLATILTNKSDWRIYVGELEKRSTNGRDAHRKAYRELQNTGYIRVVKKSDGKHGVQTFAFAQDTPITDSYFEHIKDRLEKELSTTEKE
ncbi:transcriptional regulator [Streptococcus suis]|uniref:transcriptional regulator n=1 Tax=Streptococcus suis TaxID=1307 RepID=UPI0019611241|nr:transcriptional regulator [Streptococcus suis]MBM7313770.1 transcriptional regulator [Streptococcus suis]